MNNAHSIQMLILLHIMQNRAREHFALSFLETHICNLKTNKTHNSQVIFSQKREHGFNTWQFNIRHKNSAKKMQSPFFKILYFKGNFKHVKSK